jgi:hypothetical protein
MSSPSWLSTSAPAPAAAAPAAPAVDPLSIESGKDATATSASEERDLPSIILMTRLVNMGAAVALITVAVSVNNEYKTSRLCFSDEVSIRNEFDDCFNEHFSVAITLYIIIFALPLTILRIWLFIFPFHPN